MAIRLVEELRKLIRGSESLLGKLYVLIGRGQWGLDEQEQPTCYQFTHTYYEVSTSAWFMVCSTTYAGLLRCFSIWFLTKRVVAQIPNKLVKRWPEHPRSIDYEKVNVPSCPPHEYCVTLPHRPAGHRNTKRKPKYRIYPHSVVKASPSITGDICAYTASYST
jgi:hypothetical protein